MDTVGPAWSLAEPIDLRCSPSTVADGLLHSSGLNSEPLDLTTSQRPHGLAMDHYYSYQHYSDQFDQDKRRSYWPGPSYLDHDRPIPYGNPWDYTGYTGYNTVNWQARYQRHPSKPTCKYSPYPQPYESDSDTERSSCVYSTRRTQIPKQEPTIQESLHKDHNRTLFHTNGGSCKYGSKSPLGSRLQEIDHSDYPDILNIPMCRYDSNKFPRASADAPKSSPFSACNTKKTKVFVANNKHFTGGFVTSNTANDSDSADVLPPLSIPDFTFIEKSDDIKPEMGNGHLKSDAKSEPIPTEKSTEKVDKVPICIKQETAD